MSDYFLSEHARVCVRDDQLIIMDLMSGQYLALTQSHAAGLHQRIGGWPVIVGNGERQHHVLQQLIDRGIVTADSSHARVSCPVEIARAVGWIGEIRRPGRTTIGVQHVWRFFVSVLTAWLSLRFMKMPRIISRVAKRKAIHEFGGRNANLARVAELRDVFDTLRPFAFRKHDACLLYSFALLEFLAHYKVFADWIFGVRTGPFSAHCWLQCGEHLVTDPRTSVEQWTPIMVV